ncbi:MAG: RpoL/Rpb11 RNA polymerase subunit family protein [Promethearchaeota archaeon]
MGKKKKIEPETKNDDELEKDLFEDDEIESVYPKIKKEDIKKEGDSEIDDLTEIITETEEEIEDESFDLDLEEEPKAPEYKYFNLSINRGATENDYELICEGQSHGFCNIFVKHLLEIEGVEIAAYKITGIIPPQIFIKLKKGYKIKKILNEGIESVRAEVKKVQTLFQKIF